MAACFSLLPVFAQTATLRVCADPNNLPFSNRQQQGLENKLADLVAASMNTKVEYRWWVERKSFAKKSLNAGACDAVMGIPRGMDDVLTTDPYYRSSYVFVSRQDRNLQIESLSDPRLAELRIGVHVVGDDYAPPAFALAHRGIVKNVIGFSLYGAYGEADPPRKLIGAVENGDIDVAIAWGPLAGYFAQGAKLPLTIAPVEPPVFLGVPFAYDISIGVREGDASLQQQLNRILQQQSSAIQALLASYGVPQVH
ncbi:MAG: quinoprotein dehydrogenase-associated putative ABC transporter substrate-binding protein [Acidobacteriaceae bacterium]|nr:quinoprotein dehydrogenase-associated putative ABC transporter substrate-binding protein [Acidobacteriaceae bacterium]